MHTTTNEIADGIYRFSTYVAEADFEFNQFLVTGDEPLLFHTGPKPMFPLIKEAVAGVIPVESLRWISFGHVENDECGSMNLWLAPGPQPKAPPPRIGCMVSVNDLAIRPPH